jgi:predicted porin
MQKKLLVVAVAGALAAPGFALAQSSAEVYGTVNMAFGNFKYSDGTLARTANGATPANVGASVSKWDVANGASNYGVRARESLGGGMSGWVQIEQNAPLERSSNQAIKPASRNSAIGLEGNFGNVFMGQWTTPWADLDALWGVGTVGFWGPVTSLIGRRETTGTAVNYNCQNGDGATPGAAPGVAGKPICDALQGGGGVGHAFWRRASNAVFYQSPVFSGFQGKLAFQTNEGKAVGNAAGTNANAQMWSGSVQWAGMGGRARVGAAIDKHKDFTTIGQTDSGWSVKGGFNFGVADIGVAYEDLVYKCGTQPFGGLPGLCASAGDIKVKQYGVGAAIPVGPGSIRASYSKATGMKGVVTVGQTDAKEYNIGYEHRFSKRTNIGIGYAKIDNNQNANFTWTGAPPNQTQSAAGGPVNTPLFGSDVSTFFISMTHRF